MNKFYKMFIFYNLYSNKIQYNVIYKLVNIYFKSKQLTIGLNY